MMEGVVRGEAAPGARWIDVKVREARFRVRPGSLVPRAVRPDIPVTMTDPARAFIDRSRHLLMDEYRPKIRRCLERLSPDDLWWRPNEASNSVGNLVLHLCGNVRQWVVHGLAGREDVRTRDAEFAAEGGLDAGELARRLDEVLAEVDGALAELDPDVLDQARTIQGLEVTGLHALYHAVEHFSMHTGQILYVTKLRTGRDLGFYRVEDGTVETRW